ncbi:MAG TPA: carbonic anhydrase [Acidobacteriaceae bacterium]|nr:carbonic anhydrase [Acidobacteriaceae bacterium]
MPDSTSCDPILPASASTQNSRRNFLFGTAAAFAGVVAAGIAADSVHTLLDPDAVLAQTTLTPDAALKELMDGNRRFASGNTTAYTHDLNILKQHLVEKQEPFAAVLSCADSRVPVEIVFDQTIGHLFVTRVAGNIITPEIVGSLEYGVAVLGTKVILVLGHSNCGAVKAAVAGKAVPGQISTLYAHLQPAVDEAGPDYKAATKANAKIQAKLLSQASTVVSEKIKEGQLKVVAGYYDIGSGVVTLLG